MTYYEKEWICAYLEKDNDLEKAISDATSIGYKMAKPSVLKSKKSWTIEDKTIYPSLPGIKGIGDAAVAELLKIRSENEFKDFYDFLWTTTEKKFKNGKTRIKRHWRWSKFNKRAFDALIKLEAFDDFDLVGPDKFFKNYKHLYDVVIENYDKTKRGTVKLEEFAAEEYED